jgi:hypothetical protein
MSELFEFEPALAPETEPRFHPYWFPEPDGVRERVETPTAPVQLAPHARRRRPRASILPSEPGLFPWLERRFAPGEVTLWTGPRVAVDPVLELVYAGSALRKGRVSLLEGANRFHPYRIAELGRVFGVDPTETLRRVRLARAFTAYQMVALVDGWAAEARRHPPTLLVAHDLPAMFAADEVPDDERAALLRHVARTLRALAESVRVPLLVTLAPGGLERFPGLTDEGPRWADLVTFVRGRGTLKLRAMRDDARLAVVPRPGGQRGMEEFGGGSTTEEVIAWGAPPRRTVRRSKSG